MLRNTWTVRSQSRDQGALIWVIPVCSSAWQLPAEVRDSHLLVCLITASWAAWFLPAHLLEHCQLSRLIPAFSAAWLLPAEPHNSSQLKSMIIACSLHDSCLLSSLIIASWGTSSVYDSHVISTWSPNPTHGAPCSQGSVIHIPQLCWVLSSIANTGAFLTQPGGFSWALQPAWLLISPTFINGLLLGEASPAHPPLRKYLSLP